MGVNRFDWDVSVDGESLVLKLTPELELVLSGREQLISFSMKVLSNVWRIFKIKQAKSKGIFDRKYFTETISPAYAVEIKPTYELLRTISKGTCK